jgi:hypothetical protein
MVVCPSCGRENPEGFAFCGRPGAEEPLCRARELFAAMGYTTAIAAADAVLEQLAGAPAS